MVSQNGPTPASTGVLHAFTYSMRPFTNPAGIGGHLKAMRSSAVVGLNVPMSRTENLDAAYADRSFGRDVGRDG